MSNPEPGLERSKRWHRPAIIGIIVALALAGLAALILAPAGSGDDPPGAVEELAPATDAPEPVPAPAGTATGQP